jgi:hypothetical protein
VSTPATGQCLCGRVRFELAADPLLTMACHCRGCQRLTGGAYSLSTLYLRAAFRVTEGSDQVVRGGLQGEHGQFHCAFCKCWLFTEPNGLDDFVNVRTAMLDDPPQDRPFIALNLAEGFEWAATPAAHRYDNQPADDEWPALLAEFQQLKG